jgi:hypothetical protein
VRREGRILVLDRYLGEDFSLIDQGKRRLRIAHGQRHVLH